MASALKNALIPGGAAVVGLIHKLTRGKSTVLGDITAANDAVAFSVPEPTRDNQGTMVIQVAPGPVTPVYALEVNLDGGVSFNTLTLTPITGASFVDLAASSTVVVSVAGFGGEA